MSAIENETVADTTTFEYFDREWTIPTTRHLSHLRRLRDELRVGYVSQALVLAETFLGEEQFDALTEIDPDESDLTEFAGEIAKLLGYGNSGN